MRQTPDQPDPQQGSLSEDIHNLLAEHLRLRSDVQQLLSQHQQLLKEKADRPGRQEQNLQRPPGRETEEEGEEEQKKDQPERQGEEEGEEQKEGKEKEGEREKEGEGGKEGGEERPKKNGGKKGGKEEQEGKKEKPKAPLRRRTAAWAQTHPFGFALSLAALVLAAVAAFFLWNYLQSYESTDDAQIDGHTHQIGARISGYVTGVYTENNRSVVKNQTLVDIDPRDYQAALAQAQANLDQAIAALHAQTPSVPITQTTEATNVETTRLRVTNAEAALQNARHAYESTVADLRQAEANAENAAVEERRYRELVEKQEVSREEYDRRATTARAQSDMAASRRAAAEAARKAVDQQQAALNEARERYREARANQPRQVAVQQSNVATRRANVEAAQAQVTQAGLNLSYCKVLAPISGIVGDKSVEVGQQISPGQELLAITGIEDIWVTANFKETQIKHMQPGQGVTIHVDALGQDFDGYVKNMPGATGAVYSLLPPENATGNYVKVVQRLPVRIRFKEGQNGLNRLRPGMSVEPKVWVK